MGLMGVNLSSRTTPLSLWVELGRLKWPETWMRRRQTSRGCDTHEGRDGGTLSTAGELGYCDTSRPYRRYRGRGTPEGTALRKDGVVVPHQRGTSARAVKYMTSFPDVKNEAGI